MGMAVRFLHVGAAVALLVACGGGSCPQSGVVAVPPKKLTRLTFKLPLGEDGRNGAKRFLLDASCQGSDCRQELNEEEFCAIEALFDPGPYAKKLMRCDGAEAVQIYDPRELLPTKGVVLGGWVFAVYQGGMAGAEDEGPKVIVFPQLSGGQDEKKDEDEDE